MTSTEERSLPKPVFTDAEAGASGLMRSRGVHILDNFPCFLTTEHSAEDLAKIVAAYKAAALGYSAASPTAR